MSRNNIKWSLWAAIGSSIAAVLSLLLFGYQLFSDRPSLKTNLQGAAFADYEQYHSSYFVIWLSAFNHGKRPIGLMDAKLKIIFPDRSQLEPYQIPIFPLFNLQNETNSPTIDVPFFYEVKFFDDFVEDKLGHRQQIINHPHEMKFHEIILDVSDYRKGYLIFKIHDDNRVKFLHNPKGCKVILIFKTTDNDKTMQIKSLDNWNAETLSQRFLMNVGSISSSK